MSLVNITKLYEEFSSIANSKNRRQLGGTSSTAQKPASLLPPSACNTCCHAAAPETGDQIAQVDVLRDAQDPDADGTGAAPPAAATVKASVQKNAACQASLVLLDHKDLKRILKRAVVSSLFKLISRHESRVYARERWLMKRLKKSLGKFERTMTALMTKTVKEQLAKSKEQATLQEPLPLSAPMPAAASPKSSNRPRSTTAGRHNWQLQKRHQRLCQTVSLETATCLAMQDSETAVGAAAAAAAAASSDSRAITSKRRHPQDRVNRITVNTQMISEQQNSNNAFVDYSDDADDYYNADEANPDGHSCLIPRRVKSPARDYWRHSSSQSSTRTTFSVDSLSESGCGSCGSVDTEPVYSGFNIATSSAELPFPRFPAPNANCNHGESTATSRRQRHSAWPRLPRQYCQPPEQATSSLIYGDIPPSEENANATPPMQPAPQPPPPPPSPPRPQQQCQHQHRIDQQQRQQQRQQKQAQTSGPKSANIYSPARPVATSIHRAKPGVCQCHAAAAAAGEGTPCHQQQQPQPRCRRCPSLKPRRCPKRQQQQRRKQKNRGGNGGGECCRAKSSRRRRCKPGEASCGDCQPPRIVLCPAKRGLETFSRIRLQTQPGRFITRQVLFFDGSYLYKPVQPKCY